MPNIRNADNKPVYNTKQQDLQLANRKSGENYNKEQDIIANTKALIKARSKMLNEADKSAEERAYITRPRSSQARSKRQAEHMQSDATENKDKTQNNPDLEDTHTERDEQSKQSHTDKAAKVPASKKYMRTWAILGGDKQLVIKSARNIIANLLNVAKYNPKDFSEVELIIKVDDNSKKILEESGYLTQLAKLGVKTMTPHEIGELAKDRIPKTLNLQTPEEVKRVCDDIDTVSKHLTTMLKADVQHTFIANELNKLDKFIAAAGQIIVSDKADSVLTSLVPSQNVAKSVKSNAYVTFSGRPSSASAASHNINQKRDDELMAAAPNMDMFNAQISRAAESIRAMQQYSIKLYKTEDDFNTWKSSGLSRDDSWIGKSYKISDILGRPELLNMRFDREHVNELLELLGLPELIELLGKKTPTTTDERSSLPLSDLYYMVANPFAWHNKNPNLKEGGISIAGASEFGVIGLYEDGELTVESENPSPNQALNTARQRVIESGKKLKNINEDMSLSLKEWLAKVKEAEDEVIQSLSDLHKETLNQAKSIKQTHGTEQEQTSEQAQTSSYQLALYKNIETKQSNEYPKDIKSLASIYQREQRQSMPYDSIYYQTYIVGSNREFLLKSLSTATVNTQNLNKNAPKNVKLQLILDAEAMTAISEDPKLSEHMNYLQRSDRVDVRTVQEIVQMSDINAENIMSPHHSVTEEFKQSVHALASSLEDFKKVGKHSFGVDLIRMIGYNLNPNSINIKSESDAIIIGSPSDEVIQFALDGKFITTAFIADNIPISRSFMNRYYDQIMWSDMTMSACHSNKFFGMVSQIIGQANHLNKMKETPIKVYKVSDEKPNGEFVSDSNLYNVLTSKDYQKLYIYGGDVNKVMGKDSISGFSNRKPVPNNNQLRIVSDFSSEPNIMTAKAWKDGFMTNPFEKTLDIGAFAVVGLDFKSCIESVRCWGVDQKKEELKIPAVNGFSGVLMVKGYYKDGKTPPKSTGEADTHEDLESVKILMEQAEEKNPLTQEEDDSHRNGNGQFNGYKIWESLFKTKDALLSISDSIFGFNQDSELIKITTKTYKEIEEAAKTMNINEFLSFANANQAKFMAMLSQTQGQQSVLASQTGKNASEALSGSHNSQSTSGGSRNRFSGNVVGKIAFEEPLVETSNKNRTLHIPNSYTNAGRNITQESRTPINTASKISNQAAQNASPDGVAIGSAALGTIGAIGIVATGAYMLYQKNKAAQKNKAKAKQKNHLSAIERMKELRLRDRMENVRMTY